MIQLAMYRPLSTKNLYKHVYTDTEATVQI